MKRARTFVQNASCVPGRQPSTHNDEITGPPSFRTRSKTKIPPINRENSDIDDGYARSTGALYLLSLPTEILREVIILSIDDLEALDAEPLLFHVLALQNVCRHFRAITRDIPQFWTYLTTSMPDFFDDQMELSRNHDLRFKLETPDLRYKGIREFFKDYSHRWRSLYIVSAKQRRFVKLFTEHTSTLTFDNVTNIRIKYGDHSNSDETEAVSALISRMPNLLRMETFNHVPPNRVAPTITSLSVIQNLTYCSRLVEEIIKFIIAHPLIEKLRLHAPYRHKYARSYLHSLDDPSFRNIRKLEVTFVIDGIASLNAWEELWTDLVYIGVSRLNIEIVDSQDTQDTQDFLFKTLYKFRVKHFLEELSFTELSISADIDNDSPTTGNIKWCELPLGLRLLEMIDCSPAVVNYMIPLVENLLARQAKSGKGTLEKVVIKGRATSVDTRSYAERRLGIDRLEYI